MDDEQRVLAVIDEDTCLVVENGFRAVSQSLDYLASTVIKLGNGDADTPMGAMEAYGRHMGEVIDQLGDKIGGGLEEIAMALVSIAQAISAKH